MTRTMDDLPVIVVGAGPVGLATAAHLLERGLTPVVLEAGPSVGAAIRQWGHTRLFSPWRYNIDDAARRLLEPTGWQTPEPDALPTGHELVRDYLDPLAAALDAASGAATGSPLEPAPARDAGPMVRTGVRVVAVSRDGIDKTRSANRENTPFLVRVTSADGSVRDLLARSVIDASGTWAQPNPLGRSGLPAPGEAAALATGHLTAPLPDVLGGERTRFAGRHVVVVGAGHSAAGTLLDLVDLARQEPATRISWAVRTPDVARVYGGEDRDELAARGALGTRLREAVEAGVIEVHTSFVITGFSVGGGSGGGNHHDDDAVAGAATPAAGPALTVHADTPDGPVDLAADLIVPATGFRPDLSILSELRLHMDTAVDAPHQLGPLIDPEFHSCGSVPPHGERLLAHPEPGFYIVGMKSYGRAPTFLMATGYEQVRSIAAALAGDREAADDVRLDLPETGVCSTDIGTSCETSSSCETPDPTGGADSCCAPAAPQLITLGGTSGTSCC